MKALTYHGARDVRLDDVEEPRLLAPDDIIVRITSTAICGSDLFAQGYELFNEKRDNCRKVVLHAS